MQDERIPDSEEGVEGFKPHKRDDSEDEVQAHRHSRAEDGEEGVEGFKPHKLDDSDDEVEAHRHS